MDVFVEEADSSENSEMKCRIWKPSEDHQPELTDLTLVVDGNEFKVHKHVLETNSDYFRAMFSSGMKENEKDTITIKLLQLESFQFILEGIYKGKLDLNESNIFQIAEAAHLLQLQPSLFSQCTEFLRSMIDKVSCFEVLHICDTLNLVDVYSEAKKYCISNFSSLRHCESFLELTLLQFYNYLSEESLVVQEEIFVVEAIKEWLNYNKQDLEDTGFQATGVRKLILSCVCLKDSDKSIDRLTNLLLGDDDQFELEKANIIAMLGARERVEDVFMFWSLLNSTRADGLVDVLKLCQTTGQAAKFDSMTDVVENPGYDLGSAFCVNDCCVYLSGGGPNFGKVNWIRKMFKFDLSKSTSRWEEVGELYETRRHHAMLAVGSKLYIFGGFGKFRAKNIKLDCFDLVTKTWQTLPETPTHEIKPVAASSHSCLFYMDRMYELHCFDTDLEKWSSITTMCSPRLTPGLYTPPLAIFPLREDPNSLLALLNGQSSFTLVKCGSGLDCTTLHKMTVPKDGRYEGCGLANRKLFILLGGEEAEDERGDFQQFASVKRILTYCTVAQSVESIKDTNVRKALTILTAPHIPVSFSPGSAKPFP